MINRCLSAKLDLFMIWSLWVKLINIIIGYPKLHVIFFFITNVSHRMLLYINRNSLISCTVQKHIQCLNIFLASIFLRI